MDIENCIKFLARNNNLKYYYNKSADYHLPNSVRLDAEFDGHNSSAWGVSANKDLAFFKALMELIERQSMLFSCGIEFKEDKIFSRKKTLNEVLNGTNLQAIDVYPLNSNGVGLGLSLSQAKISAFRELIERHTILLSIAFEIPPIPYNLNLSGYKLPKGYPIETFYWINSYHYISISLVKCEGGGFYFGFGCSNTLEKSAIKSFEELTPSLIYSINDHINPSNDFEIKKDDIMSFSRYWRFSGDQRMYNFLKSGSHKKDFGSNDIPQIKKVYYSELFIPFQFGGYETKVRCVRAISPEAQQLFFDNWDISYMNPNLYKKNSLPDFPHPIA